MYQTRTVEFQFEEQYIINQNQVAFQINEILYIEKKKFVLSMHNTSAYQLKTNIRLLTHDKTENIENICIPANAQIILPLDLIEINEIDNMRVMLTGEVLQQDEEARYPIKVVEFPKQLPQNIH